MIKVPLDHVTENQRKQTFIKVTEEMKLMRRTKHKRRKGAGGPWLQRSSINGTNRPIRDT